MTLRPSIIGLLLLIATFGAACKRSSASPKLRRVQCLAIEGSRDSICLYRDLHLDSAAMDSLWFTGQDSGHAQAEIRRISPAGRVLATFALEPLARLDEAKISGQQFVLATEDLSIGAGSYRGPITHVLDISRPGRIDTTWDNKGSEITVMASLKTVWKTVPDGILEAACRPSMVGDSMIFVRYYDRIRYRNGKWIRTWRSEQGYDDFGDDEAFPSDTLFPQ